MAVSLVADGLVGGVGAVLGFVPQKMLILFFLLATLEDCGYIARIASIMDKLLLFRLYHGGTLPQSK